MSFAYSVAIKLSVANLATQGLRLLTGDLLAAHGAAGKLEGKLKALKMIAVGYGIEKIGAGAVGFIEKSIDASKEYTRQLSLMNAAGMSQRDIALSTAAAWKTSRDVLTTTAADNLKAIRELRSVFGNKRMDEAYAILPTVQRTRATMEALTGKPQENVAFDMVKAIELRTPGLMTSEAMQRNADLMARSLMAFGGTINVNDFHKTLKQTKQAAFGLNDEFVYDYLPTLMQEVKAGPAGGAQTAGTAIATLYRSIVQGVIKKSSIPVWEEMGLIKPSDVVRNATGSQQLKPGAIAYAQLFQKNPFAFAEKYAPIIAAYGEKHHLNREQVISGMLADRNAQWLLNTLIAKAPQFKRDKELVESGGTSIEAYQKLMKTNPQLAEQALHAQWQNILSILGFQILPRLIPWMVKFADGLDKVSQWMARNGPLTQTIALGLAGVGIALSVLGKVMLTAGIIKFLGMGPSLTSVAGSMGTLATALGNAGLIGAAAAAGYGIGSLVWHFLEGTKAADKFGEAIARVMAFFGSKEAQDAVNTNNPDPHKGMIYVTDPTGFSGKGGTGRHGHWAWPTGNLDLNAPSIFGNSLDKGGGSPSIATKAQAPINLYVQNKVDERGLTTMVTRGLARDLMKPLSGANFDGSQDLASVLLNHAR